MIKRNILITSAGRRVSLVKAFQHELENLNIEGKVFCTDLVPELSSACQIADKAFKVKRVTEDNYIEELLSLSIKHNVKLIIPTIDTELKELASSIRRFKDNDIDIIISDEPFVDKCRDKREIHCFFDEIGFERARDIDINKANYPIFVKPVDGSRSIGIFKLETENDLSKEILTNPKNMFLEYLSPNENTEYTVDIYFNKESEILSIIPRERIFVRDGEVNKACTRKNEIVSYIKEKFRNLRGIRGCITLQVFKNNLNGKIIGIEINPRFGGGYPLSYLAGGNFPRWIIQEYMLNQRLVEYKDDWKDNTLMLRYDAEVITHGFKN